MTNRLTLVTHHLCPFVQRAAIVLAEKDVAFDRISVDLADKPNWFLAISPLGKVPLSQRSQLVAGDGVRQGRGLAAKHVDVLEAER